MGNQNGNCYTSKNEEKELISIKPIETPQPINKKMEREVNKSTGIEMTQRMKNGNLVTGKVENMVIKKGQIKYVNGDIFNGNISNGKANGLGEIRYINGDFYRGLFLNNLKNGDGAMTYKNGSVFKGIFKDDLYEGFGVFRFNNGNMYKGI